MRKIFVFILLLPLISCDNWLEVESEESVTFVNYFKSEQDLQSLLITMLDNERRQLAPGSVDEFGWSGLQCNTAGGYEGFRKLDPNSYPSTKLKNWKLWYDIIYLANLMEENRFRFENITEERADYWIAQANFAKALAYFQVACRWGDAPIARSSESTEALGKSPAIDVLKEAIRCAEKALSLPKFDQLTNARGETVISRQYASVGTVHTLLANIYAWMGGLTGERDYWVEAEKHASEVIGGRAGTYDLERPLANMVKNTLGKTRQSCETIFSIEISTLDYDRFWASEFEEPYPGFGLIDFPYTTTDPQSIAYARSAPRITVDSVKGIYSDPGDLRRQEFWYKLGEELELSEGGGQYLPEYAYLNKWREPIYSSNPEIKKTYSGAIAMEGNRVIWRLADLILLRAECRARLGLATAKDDLDRIRERAGLGNYTGPTEAEALRKEIFHERERELFGEGQRYYDIVRNGYFREELGGNYKTLTDQEVKNGALYLPLAPDMFGKNTLMKQNIYWSWHLIN